MSVRSAWAEALFRADPNGEFRPGFTVGQFVRLLTPPAAPVGVRHETEVVYGQGGDRAMTLHLYRHVDNPGARPAVVFVHGGAWSIGDPLMLIHHADYLARHGYVTASVSYRLASEARWPACLEDAKCAVRWMRSNAARLGVDPARIGIAGESAGAHLAAMIALTPGRFEGDGGHPETPSDVAAAVLWSPPTDLRMPGAVPLMHDMVRGLLGSDSHAAISGASPWTYITSAAPATLTFAARDDSVTPLPMIREFHRTLDESGVTNRLDLFDGEHGFDVFEPELRRQTFERMRTFFDLHLQPN